jgi:hypothetical protein
MKIIIILIIQYSLNKIIFVKKINVDL